MDSLASSVSLMMVSDKLGELLRPSTGKRLPKELTDVSAVNRTIQALNHLHRGPAFSDESPDPVRIVMGKMVKLAFEVSLLSLHLWFITSILSTIPNNQIAHCIPQNLTFH